MIVVCDTGPLVAAANTADEAHGLAAALVSELGRELLVPIPIAVEADYLLRARVSVTSARALLASFAGGQHRICFLTPSLVRRAAEIDAAYAGLDLGLADGAIMAIAESAAAPVLTFDFAHFRATRPRRGHWRLVVDESRYFEAIKPG